VPPNQENVPDRKNIPRPPCREAEITTENRGFGMDAKQRKELTKLPFEQALERLEAVVARMEGGQSPLDQMMRDFEEGNALADACGKQLQAIEKKIEILVKDDGGNGRWQDLPDADAEAAPAEEKDEDEDDKGQAEDSLF
jgi:exodeoxyribonuclease VII small subunit